MSAMVRRPYRRIEYPLYPLRTLDRRQNLTQLKASKGGREMAFERTPPLPGVGDRAPHNDAVGAALLNINDEHRAILSGPLRACLDRRGLKVGIARTQWPADMRDQFWRSH